MFTFLTISLFVICTILLWRIWSEILHVPETYAEWRAIQRAHYASAAWKRLLDDILAEKIASGVYGEWDLPPKLAQLSATRTINITRFPDGLVTLLFTTQNGRFFDYRIYRGYLVCSRKLAETDMQVCEYDTGSYLALPFDASAVYTNKRTAIHAYFPGHIVVGREVEPKLYEINHSYNIRNI